MATQQELDRLIGQALADDDFRHRMLENPQATAATLGIELDRQQVARIRRIRREEADRAARDFQVRSAAGGNNIEPTGFW